VLSGTAALGSLRQAGQAIRDCYQEAADADGHLLDGVLGGSSVPDFEEETRYPQPDGVRDAESGCSAYYHSHLDGEHGHFHLFIRASHIPEGLGTHGPDGPDAHIHLLAISLDPFGLPSRLFTVNRSVSGGSDCTAPVMCRLLDLFCLASAVPEVPRVARWLHAMLELFRSDIEKLILALEQPDLHIVSSCDVDLDARIAAIDAAGQSARWSPSTA
jgi:hypothetical protein